MTFRPSNANAVGKDIKMTRVTSTGAVALSAGNYITGLRVAGTTDDLVIQSSTAVNGGDAYETDDVLPAGQYVELTPLTSLNIKTLGSGGIVYVYAV